MKRRDLLRTSIAAASAPLISLPRSRRPPNFLFLLVDQLHIDALSAYGCPWVRTPNIDRLIQSGVSFRQSYCTNPLCSPARSSLLTGRMPVETGVVNNGIPIDESIPNVGQWLGRHGYQTVYCGKWHLPQTWQESFSGFHVIPVLGEGEGDMKDPLVALAWEAYLRQRSPEKPFFFVGSLLQPHDICFWAIQDYIPQLVPKRIPFENLVRPLPDLPPNVHSRPPAPKLIAEAPWTPRDRSDEQWRFYIYCYYRMVEMLDADVGRMLDALEASGAAGDTVVIFTSDHGEGLGRHGHVQKHFPYEEAAKVPLVISSPGRVSPNLRNNTHLVSGVDVVSTICDFAGIPAPPNVRGLSLKPLCEGKSPAWRDFVVTEAQQVGRMVRTKRYKYVSYQDDPVKQLFDLEADPWEMNNLYGRSQYAGVVADHHKLLEEFEAGLIPAQKPRAR
jgi:arylsulfatase A-like enzyme